MRYLKLLWSAVTSLSTLAWLLSLGIGGLVTTGLSQVVTLETPWNGVFFVSAFLVAWALAVPFSKVAISWLSVALQPARRGPTPAARNRGAELRTIRTIRSEIDAGARIVERAIGQEQVREVVSDVNWIAHRNSLAEISDAGDAFRLAGIAWEGFGTYNRAVKGRRFISNDTLQQIAKDGQQAVDALEVAADNLR